MPRTFVIADGGVASLLAATAAARRAATGPASEPPLILIPGLPETDPRAAAAAAHAAQLGLQTSPLPSPIPDSPQDADATLRLLLEAALLLREAGGGEVMWPTSGLETPERDADIAAISLALNQSTLITQLVNLETPPTNHAIVRAPYADLSDRQLADLVLDMDLPIWMCWWMAVAATDSASLRERASHERAKWANLLKEAGWCGSLESRAVVVRPITSRTSSAPSAGAGS